MGKTVEVSCIVFFCEDGNAVKAGKTTIVLAASEELGYRLRGISENDASENGAVSEASNSCLHLRRTVNETDFRLVHASNLKKCSDECLDVRMVGALACRR